MNSKLSELEIVQEKDINNSYLVIKNVHIEKENYESKVFDEVLIDNVMKYVIDREEGIEVLKYDISDVISLNDYLKFNKLKKKDLVFIIKNIYNLLGSIENYLISENSIMLDTKTLMLKKENDKTILQFCIIPCMESDFSYELSRLLVRLLRHIDTKDSDALNLAYNLFIKSSKKNYSITDLMQVIDEATEKEVACIDEEYDNLIENYGNNVECEGMYYLYENEEKNENKKEIVENVKTEDVCYINKNDNSFNLDFVDNSEKENDSKKHNDIEMDEDTKKELNDMLFDKIDDNKNEMNNNVKNIKKIKKEKKRMMLNANIKFNIAIFPMLAILVPVFAYYILGADFFIKHYMMLVFYEVVIVLIITLNTLLDSLWNQ